MQMELESSLCECPMFSRGLPVFNAVPIKQYSNTFMELHLDDIYQAAVRGRESNDTDNWHLSSPKNSFRHSELA